MKKALLLLVTLFSLQLFSQGLTVQTASPQVLSDNIVNTKCVTTSNWVVKSGSDFANPNSVGTFIKPASANFPFSRGVVLSTGNINNVPGPKTLPNYIGDGTLAWPGDSDMNAALGAVNFTNASSLEFDFTSQQNTFKLNYIFASEEYGNNQCLAASSDAMVILLTDITAGTASVNIAKTATTNQIITVSNIRDNTYNTSCPSANASLFGAFYDAPNNSTAPINFFGRTVSMTASATIDPTHTYHVKIVVADRNDIQYDSAVFLEQYVTQYQAQNILGNDLTIANNAAKCEGQSYTFNTGLNPSYTYLWRKNGVAISGATGPSYTIPAGEAIGTNTYNVIYTFDTCNNPDGFFDSITIDFIPPVVTPDPIPINRCVGDTNPYNLAQNTAVVSNGLPYTPIVSYHGSFVTADNNTSPLPLSYNGPLTTIFIRIQQPGNPCPAIKQFTLGTTNPPSGIIAPPALELCSRTPTILNAITNLASLNSGILNGLSPAIYGVSYHTSQVGADTNTDIIALSSTGSAIISTNITTVFVRVFVIGSQDCYTTTNFQVTISPLLAVDQPENVVYCGPSYTLPTLTNGKYFTNAYDGINPNSQLPEIPALSQISIPTGFVGTYSQTIYVSNLVTSASPCTEEFPLTITLIQPSSFTETDTTVCDEYFLPQLQYGDYWTGPNGTGMIIPGGTKLTTTTTFYFNFQSSINTPLNPSCNVPAGPVTITIENKPDLGPDRQNVFTCNPPYILPSLAAYPGAKYYTNAGGTGTQLADGTPIFSSQDIYVYLEDTIGTLNCPNDDKFRVVVGLDPIADITECTYILPQPLSGNYYSGPGGTGIQYPVGYNVENSIMPIYLYVAPPPGETCAAGQNEVSFNIVVTHPPVDDIPNFTSPYCGDFQLPILTNGKYYTESHLNGGSGGSEIPAGYIVNTNQTIYVYNFTPGSSPLCDFEKKYDFIINPIPPIDNSVNSLIDLCSTSTASYTLPSLTDGNYYTGPFGTGQLLNTPETMVVNGPFPVTLFIYNIDPVSGCENQRAIRITSSVTLSDDPANPIVEACTSYNLPDLIVPGSRYHRSYWDPTDPNNTSSTPPPGIIIPDPSVWTMPDPTQPFYDQTIYIYNSTLDGVRETCPVNKPIRIILYRQPTIAKPNDVYVCGSDYTLPILPTSQKYFKESHLGGGTTFTEISGTITESQRIYIYEVNNSILPNSTFKCEDEEFFDVNIFKIDTGTDLTGCGSVTLPNLTSGSYFEGLNGTTPIINNVITNNSNSILTKTIFIYDTSGFPSGECQSLENSFTISITPIPTANLIPLYDADPLINDRTFCDTDDTNDGVLTINLSQYDATILGTQTGSEYSVTYHSSENDALSNTNIITESLSNNNSLYAVVRNSNFQSCSSVPMKIEFVVNLLPEPTPQDDFLCVNNITGLPISTVTLDSGLSGSYTYEWKDATGNIVGTSSTLTTNMLGNYTLTATDADPTKGCVSIVKTVTVFPSSTAITGYILSQDFDDNQIITVIANGYGDNYVYQLDSGLFQESNVFTNVLSGNHTLVIRDKNGCGDSAPIEVLILNYPKFFTPNGDSYNDYWNIYDLQELNDSNTKISIFDRQGKLLKQISPYGQGWDGNYNGNQLPATDYWFRVNYVRDGVSREFKSHFALKR